MAKIGGTKHLKRIAVPKAMPIFNKKEHVWLSNPLPGPHSGKKAMSLGVLLRDVLHIAQTANEIKKVLSQRLVSVDGKIRTTFRFPVGFMDVVSLAKADKSYRVVIDNKGRLAAKEIHGEEIKVKILRVTKKMSGRGKIVLGTQDGRTMLGDNNVNVGDSIVVDLPKYGIKKVLKLENSSHCIIMDGKHAGKLSTIKEIIKRKEGRKTEARLVSGKEEFVTVAEYIFIVDSQFKV